MAQMYVYLYNRNWFEGSIVATVVGLNDDDTVNFSDIYYPQTAGNRLKSYKFVDDVDISREFHVAVGEEENFKETFPNGVSVYSEYENDDYEGVIVEIANDSGHPIAYYYPLDTTLTLKDVTDRYLEEYGKPAQMNYKFSYWKYGKTVWGYPTDVYFEQDWSLHETSQINTYNRIRIEPEYDYTIEQYTVRYFDYYGEVIDTQTVTCGYDATPPEVPSIVEGNVFIGWDKPSTYVGEDLDIHAKYKSSCKVEFVNYDGVVLNTVSVDKGSDVPLDEIPTSEKNGYKFIGWDKNLTNIQSSFKTYPQFESEIDVIKRLVERGCNKEVIVEVIDEDTWQVEYTLTSNDVVAESLDIKTNLSDNRQFEFGVCCASEFKLSVVKLDKTYKGRLVKVYIYLPEGDVQFCLGTYRIDSDKFSANRKQKNLVGYDKMYEIGNTNVYSWYIDTIDNKHVNNIKWFMDEFFKYFGIKYDKTSIPSEFENRVIKSDSTIKSLSGRQVLENFCQLIGGYGRMTHQYGFEFIVPNSDKTTDYVFDLDDYYNVVYEDYVVKKISGIQLVGKNAIGFYGENAYNLYVVKNNIFTAGLNEETLVNYAQYIYNRVKDISYVPFTMSTYAHPWINTCDNVTVRTFDGQFDSIILNRTIQGIVGLKETYSSRGNENREDEFETLSDYSSVVQTATKAEEKADKAIQSVVEIQGEMLKIESVTEEPTDWDTNTIYLIQGEVVVG